MFVLEVCYNLIYCPLKNFLICNMKNKHLLFQEVCRAILCHKSTLQNHKNYYLRKIFSSQFVISGSWSVCQWILVHKMAAFVQLTIFGFVLDFVVYRQTSTVVCTPQVALCWVWSNGVVKNMAYKLFVSISILIKRDLLTFTSETVALDLHLTWEKRSLIETLGTLSTVTLRTTI